MIFLILLWHAPEVTRQFLLLGSLMLPCSLDLLSTTAACQGKGLSPGEEMSRSGALAGTPLLSQRCLAVYVYVYIYTYIFNIDININTKKTNK